MSKRDIVELITARAASDGDGVNLMRVFSAPRPERFDPFLMLDDFGSDKADDYIGGFPPHPHRGFVTITYMLKGKMEHRDHLGNVGLLSDGGVQWMTAGRGVIHSEMPKQTEGEMHGFQLWLNLPAAKKMQDAHYEDVPAAQIPKYEEAGFSAKAIAGKLSVNGVLLEGYFDVEDTKASYVDFEIAPHASLNIDTPRGHTVMAYVYEGELSTPEPVRKQQLARFGEGDQLTIQNDTDQPARFIVISGQPIGEPIKQYGPFVMNTAEEIEQAVEDYRSGALVG